MRIVALNTIANRWRMYRALGLGSILVRMTADAKRVRSRCGQLDARDVLVGANLVAGGTAGGDG